MRLETLLPLGKVDPGLRAPDTPLDIHSIAPMARLLEDMSYGGLVVEETKDDPFIVLALAAQATVRLRLGTAVAIAFPRSPTVTAMSAWTLQKLSRGRFTLGLGSAGARPHRAPLRDGMVAGRAVDARVRPGGPRGVGLLAERRPASLPWRSLQPQPDGPALRSRADRASRHPDPSRRGQRGDVRHRR